MLILLLRGIVWPSLRRLKLLRVLLDGADLFLSVIPSTILKHLEVLEIRVQRAKPCEWFSGDFQSPLHTLTLQNLPLDWATIPNICHNLQSLTLHYDHDAPELIHLQSILHASSQLSKLDLFLMNSSVSDADAQAVSDNDLPNTLALSSLVELRVARSIATPEFLQWFTVPSLQKLNISATYRSVDYYLDHLLATGGVSTLQELSISHSTFTAARMIPFLRQATALRHLMISYVGGNQANLVLEELASSSVPHAKPAVAQALDSSERSMTCPLLGSIDLSFCPDIKGGPLVRLVKHRLARIEESQEGEETKRQTSSISPINTLIVDGCPYVDPDALPWLRSKVPTFSCSYLTKKQAAWKR